MFIKAKIVFSFQLEGQPNRKGGRLRMKSYAILFEIRKSLERSKKMELVGTEKAKPISVTAKLVKMLKMNSC